MYLHLHLPTLDIVAVFTTLVAAGVSLLAWYRHRDALALRSWAAALMLGSGGALLFTLRGPGTSAALFVAADALCVASYAAMWTSMRRWSDLYVGHVLGCCADHPTKLRNTHKSWLRNRALVRWHLRHGRSRRMRGRWLLR